MTPAKDSAGALAVSATAATIAATTATITATTATSPAVTSATTVAVAGTHDIGHIRSDITAGEFTGSRRQGK